VTCTQEELLQVLSKLMQERQKVKALELRLERTSPSTSPLPLTADTHQKEIEQLQKIIRDQSELLAKPTPETPSVEPYKQHIAQLQNEIDQLKKAASVPSNELSLRQEIARLSQELTELRAKPVPVQEVPDFSFELETTEKALKEAKHTISELERAVLQARNEAPSFHEEELENFRLQARELHAARKELEMKLSLALQEKQQLQQDAATNAQILLKLKQQLESFQKNSQNIDQKEHELVLCRVRIDELERINSVLKQSLEEIQEKEKHLLDATRLHEETLEKQDIELRQQKTALKQLEKDTEGQKGEIALLEEHLTRRIKECTHLTAQQEESQAELLKRDRKIERLEADFQQLQESSDTTINSFKATLATTEEEFSETQGLLEEQEEELYELRKIAERFHELEEQVVTTYKVLTKRSDPPKKQPRQAAAPSDLFTNQKTSRRYDLFE